MAPATRLARIDAPGINLIGYLNHVLGLGESARQFAGGLRASGIPHACAALELPVNFPRLPGATLPWLSAAELPYDTTVLWCNPDRYGIDLDPGQLSGRLIGRWVWELPEIPPAWRAAATGLAEIWTISEFVRRAIEPAVDVPVRIVRMGVHLERPPALDRARWGVPDDRPLFLFMFDYHSTAARKNPLGLIAAFIRAFPDPESAFLLIKSLNAANVPAAAAEVAWAAAPHRHVRAVDATLAGPERLALLAGCDCYVSLHRSEGFGMTIAEAMGYGRPVIATGFGGCTDFFDWATGFPVAWRPVRVGSSNPAYPPEGVWAEPDPVHAAACMRQVLERPDVAAGRSARAAQRIGERHSALAVGRVAARELGRLAAAS